MFKKIFNRLLIIFSLISLPSCTVMTYGSFVSDNVHDVEIIGDKVYILLSYKYIDYKRYGHSSKHTLVNNELFIAETSLSLLLEKNTLIFNQVSEIKDDSYFGLEISDNQFTIVSWYGVRCADYQWSCETIATRKSTEEYSEWAQSGKNRLITVNNSKVEVGVEHSKKNHVRLTFIEEKPKRRIMVKYRLIHSDKRIKLRTYKNITIH